MKDIYVNNDVDAVQQPSVAPPPPPSQTVQAPPPPPPPGAAPPPPPPPATMAAPAPPQDKPEGNVVRSFLEAICSGVLAAYLVVGAFAKGKGRMFKAYSVDDLDEIALDAAVGCGSKDMYFGIGLMSEPPAPGKRGKEKDVSILTCFAADIDIAGPGHTSDQYPPTEAAAMQILEHMPWKPSIVTHTGGGLHVFFLFDKPWHLETEDDRSAARALSERVQDTLVQCADQQGYKVDRLPDLARIYRIPGTYNRKLEKERPVTLVDMDGSRRYSKEDFEEHAVKARTKAPSPVVVQSQQHDPDKYPPANADSILSRCLWALDCKENAATVIEPEWFALMGIAGRCENGIEVAHEISKSHPSYSPDETDAKVEHALEYGPRTCESIASDFGFKDCQECRYSGHIKSPIELGDTRPLKQAKFDMINVMADVQDDPSVIYDEPALSALAVILAESPASYAKFRMQFKNIGIGVTELDKVVKAHSKTLAEQDDGCQYYIKDNMMFLRQPSRVTDTAMSTFAATITEEITKDDGVYQSLAVRLEGFYDDGTPLPERVLTEEEFSSLGARLIYGVGGVCYPGMQNHLQTAIQVLSKGKYVKTSIFGHTGWKKIAGDYHFLTSAGALGASGLRSDIVVDLGSSTSKLRLYDIPGATAVEVKNGVSASLGLLELTPPGIAYPALAGVYRAILGEALPVDFSLFINGLTGTRKSELAAIMLGHYGKEFLGKRLTDNFTSTANSIEKAASSAKDAIYVVDDFLIKGSSKQAAEMDALAERILRGQGNLSGRGRMKADRSHEGCYCPRGLLVCTGEDLPSGQSLLARTLVMDINDGTIDLNVLTRMQHERDQGLLAASMSGFIQWIAPQVGSLKTTLKARLESYRGQASSLAVIHGRTPDIAASLMLGLEQFIWYAKSVGAISGADAQKHLANGWKHLCQTAMKQGAHQQSQCPVQTFFYLLEEAFQAGKCHLLSKDGTTPANPEAWGWRKQNPNDPACTDMQSLGAMVGWIDGINVYLTPQASYNVCQTMGGSYGRPIGVAEKTLFKHMADQGKLLSTGSKTNTKRVTICGSRCRVLHVASHEFGSFKPSTE